ncbi:MAG: Blue (Type 1) copper protein [archaeon GW2011_AR20]|nr:MAG: Blue (Type 1) copper protein [archaeon GW2011_AR20]AQS28053.1 hypothetical protein [uncultured archaeon]AQS28545.1 hypothetical protein [uncultured archaeon]AQS28655.1 hypothetical protein [uncultured archaeon]MBS3160383.1 cupredoxin family copper-binding protein [Candidatus Woesearchaeota archaeon]
MKKRYFILVLLFLLFIAGCSSSNKNSDNQANTQINGINVKITGFAFSPAELTVKVGDTVTWVNEDSVKHTVTSDSGSELSSPLFAKSETYSHTFNTPGTFAYHCNVHPDMTGKVIVQ